MADNRSSDQCRCTPQQEARWSDRQEPPSEVIIQAVAAAEGVESSELPPLSAAVDIEALDRLLLNSSEAVCGPLCLRLAGWDVYVSADGRIKICDPSETGPIFRTPSEQPANLRKPS